MDAGNLKKLNLRLEDAIDEEGGEQQWISDLLHHPALEHLEYEVPEVLFSAALKMAEREGDHSALRVLIYSVPAINLTSERLDVRHIFTCNAGLQC